MAKSMTHSGFKLHSQHQVPELSGTAQIFEHLKTGARLLSISNSDTNKVFGISFRTPPADNTGVAHILEHSVLCGSRKYPLKEPFKELIKGSLKTFLNAFTYPDKTCYPVASLNHRDFYNLIDVYLDAVFYPRLTPQVLQQEGWHYELEKSSDPLTYKGVVFNEMKGNYSSPDRMLEEYIQQSLFPNHVYGLDSGGNPEQIPQLTFEKLKSFHQQYYHPSNSYIYFYGDDDPEKRLEIVDQYLKDYEKLPLDSSIPAVEPFEKPRQIEKFYPSGEGQDQAMVAVNWLLAESKDPVLKLAFRMLVYILVDTPGSPLRQALINSGLGEDLTEVTFEPNLKYLYFSAGLKGAKLSDTVKVEKLIFDTLQALAKTGFDQQLIEAAINTVEFRLRENKPERGFPQGLKLMQRALTTWLYDHDPLVLLAYEKPLSEVKHQINQNSHFFEDLIRKYLLDNSHRTTLTLKPDSQLLIQSQQQEVNRLAEVKSSMSDSDLQLVIQQTQQLKQSQNAPDSAAALASLPSLDIADLDRSSPKIPLRLDSISDLPLLYHDLPTNKINYLDLGFNLHALPAKLLPYAPLLAKIWLEADNQAYDYIQLTQRIGKHTGGIEPAILASSVRNQLQSTAWLFLRTKSLASQSAELFQILDSILRTPKIDNQSRIRQIVLKEKVQIEAELTPSGHQFSHTRLQAHFSESGWATEETQGVSYLFFLRQLISDIDKNWLLVLTNLRQTHELLVNRRNMLANTTLQPGDFPEFKSQLATMLQKLPSFPPVESSWKKTDYSSYEGLTLPTQVNYVSKAANIYDLGYKFDGSLLVLIKFLRNSWLWEKIRMEGGAYGAFCAFDHRSGLFSYFSYRDPNLLETLKNYDSTSDFLHQYQFTPSELARCIIGTIGELDHHLLPDDQGYISMIRYLCGDDDEFRQQIRDQVFAAKPSDFQQFCAILNLISKKGQVVVLGSESAINVLHHQHPDTKLIKVIS